jgi:hypothetical protein
MGIGVISASKKNDINVAENARVILLTLLTECGTHYKNE